jgi:hypothetical protein
MPPMSRRRLFTALSVLSLVAFLATVAVWARSESLADFVVLHLGPRKWWYVCTVRGEARFVIEPVWTTWSGSRLFALPSRNVGILSWKAYRFSLTLPLWLVTGAEAACSFRLLQRRARAYQREHCFGCGYNLTGNTSGVCPECGTPTTAGMKA